MKCAFCDKESVGVARVKTKNGVEEKVPFCSTHAATVQLIEIAVTNGYGMETALHYIYSMTNLLEENISDVEELKIEGEDYAFDDNNIRALEKMVELAFSDENIATQIFKAWLGINYDENKN